MQISGATASPEVLAMLLATLTAVAPSVYACSATARELPGDGVDQDCDGGDGIRQDFHANFPNPSGPPARGWAALAGASFGNDTAHVPASGSIEWRGATGFDSGEMDFVVDADVSGSCFLEVDHHPMGLPITTAILPMSDGTAVYTVGSAPPEVLERIEIHCIFGGDALVDTPGPTTRSTAGTGRAPTTASGI